MIYCSDRLTRVGALLAHSRSLFTEKTGVTIVEFGLCLPLFVSLAMMGVETVNFAYAHQKMGDIATLTADNISRIRLGISEEDITETLNGIKQTAGNLNFPENGRIIVSSVQPVTNAAKVVANQKIRWQRCSGALNVTSSYGRQGDLLGAAGMGPSDNKIAASEGSELIFVEVVYTYQPLISPQLLGNRTIRNIVAMNVRERTANDVSATGAVSSCAT
ncbi:TadE/TadG family type IV pilus assembly protein [Sphingomonas xinjiangensis]|uniref:TadE-like domain-containing protein n=1 Tax=Sphingomonas xinjiangensis TaxID=643568 RepID=A0A840YAN3_9SPHN|nr:TadE family protein [Sphingomonas xinjiangensis]MBB5709099.1 hypothetical protein [Sphingomonas xinjiangensis]